MSPARHHWFEDVADTLGAGYLRYSFTMGTEQEVAFLAETLGLSRGQRVLDVGCGPGRHATELARRGIEVIGVDISQRFVELAVQDAPAGASFVRGDARVLPVAAESFDVAWSLCQGGFGLVGDDDPAVLDEMARAVRPGGAVVVSAFSAFFMVRFLEDADSFDPSTGVNHERTTLRSEASGDDVPADLWTSCFTPRELRLLAARAGLVVEHLWSVAPGHYAPAPPDLDHPEHLLIARKPTTPRGTA